MLYVQNAVVIKVLHFYVHKLWLIYSIIKIVVFGTYQYFMNALNIKQIMK